MAIHRIYPNQDSTIWSAPDVAGVYGNAGKDEILEIAGYPDSSDDDKGRSKRILMDFNTEDIRKVVDSKTGGLISCSLHLPIAEASELPFNFNIEVYPVSESWQNGVGKINDVPTNTSGVTWKDRDGIGTAWSADGGSYITNTFSTSTMKVGDDSLDLAIDVTEIVKAHYSGSITNYGLILKLEDQYEDYTDASISLKYYGSDTNTIFKPYLEFKEVNDYYNPGLSELDTDNSRVYISNQKRQYVNKGSARFRISAKPNFPTRTFSTGSIYKTNYALPAASYYSIVDHFSNETIVEFSPFTNINADGEGSYFDIDMEMLAPERYYKLKVKTTLDNSTVIFSEDNLFKVVRNG